MRGPINFSGSAQGDEAEEEEEEENATRRRRKESNCLKRLWFHQDPEPWETGVRRDERCGGDAGRHIWGINWEAKTLLLGLERRDEKIWGGGKKASEIRQRRRSGTWGEEDTCTTRTAVGENPTQTKCFTLQTSLIHLLDVRLCQRKCALVSLS